MPSPISTLSAQTSHLFLLSNVREGDPMHHQTLPCIHCVDARDRWRDVYSKNSTKFAGLLGGDVLRARTFVSISRRLAISAPMMLNPCSFIKRLRFCDVKRIIQSSHNSGWVAIVSFTKCWFSKTPLYAYYTHNITTKCTFLYPPIFSLFLSGNQVENWRPLSDDHLKYPEHCHLAYLISPAQTCQL